MRYNPNVIEPKWQQYWQKNRTFKTPEMPTGEKLYALDMFPYPSGDGLHVGHPEGYTATDIVCRFARMRGKTVLHPMGFDAFGLPAEEHAIKTNVHPRTNTEKNIGKFREQLQSLGFSYDWDRELATTDVDYFRWTQFIFLVLFDTWFDAEQQKGRPIAELPIPPDVKSQGADAVLRYQDEQRLAFQSDALVNWCPALATVLANEEVIDGKSERGSHPVVRMPLRQWMLRITAYADRLEKGLDTLDWSEGIKALQRNWIGKSTGAEVDFYIGNAASLDAWKTARGKSGYPRKPTDDVLRIYTTRPDTLFGATYMVIAPEHPFVERLTTPAQAAAVKAYRAAAAAKSDRERTEDAKKKTGVFTGSYAINPVNGEKTPIWIADYVLISYGTGAIMAVPAHDERDMEFAQQYNIPIIAVVDPGDAAETNRDAVLAGTECFAGNGKAINSGKYNGLATPAFKQQIAADLASAGVGREAVNYKLRDWLFSRQRFWGEPFPILHEVDASDKPTGVVRAVDASELPVDLPHLDDFKPHGKPEPPLGKAPAEWLFVEKDGKRYKRETNTMPQWAGSCWYYLRFIDPKNDKALVDRAKEKAWMPVDLYVGGAEHAVLHLLYSRFWHKVLFDRGYVSTDEPFQKLVNQGMILGEPQFHLNEADYKANEQAIAERGLVARRVEDDDKVTYVLGVRGTNPDEMVNVPEDQTEKRQGQVYLTGTNIPLTARADKMSKSRGNVVNPDHVVQDYGADSLRLYEMFMGPLEASKPWSMAGVSGVRGFLDRAWRMIIDHLAEGMTLHAGVQNVPPTPDQLRTLHQTIGAVSKSLETMSFNTGIARLMEFVNFFTRESVRPRACMEPFVLMLAPYAPHIAEELWEALGKQNTLAYEPWPQFDPELAKEDTIEIPVQIKGKLRAKINVPPETSKEDLEKVALADPKVQELLAGQTVVKTIAVAGRMINFVTK